MSQEQLAKAIGVTQSLIGQCERGEVKEIAPSTLLRAAHTLDVNAIVHGKGQTPQAAVPLDPPVGREGD